MSNYVRAVILSVAMTPGATCGPAPAPDRSRAVYDSYTRQLLQVSADLNEDGQVDQWSYLQGNRPLRGEADTNKDGRIDRWEYFDGQAALVRIGTSSRGDGIEDTWTWPAAQNGELRVERSRQRDRHIDRREYYRGADLVRAEEDTNYDGRIDRWDSYEGSVLRQVGFDTTFRGARPNRRVIYDARGQFSRVETDDDLDGNFEVAKGVPASALPAGIPK